MAMEGTHIRLALDLKEKLDITDEASYIIGAVYPDSRYLTKIDRSLTHPKDYKVNLNFNKDDFHKGWFTHLLCDDIQYEIIQEIFPEVGVNTPGQHSDEWIKRTSIKLLQDLSDIKKFNIKTTLDHLDNVENPNGENVEVLKKYNSLLQDIYKIPEEVNFDSYITLFSEFGLDEELCKRLIKQSSENNNQDFSKKLEAIYPEILKRAENYL